MVGFPPNHLVGGNSNIFLFSPKTLGKMILDSDEHIFQMG